jgi:hypothetical protein
MAGGGGAERHQIGRRTATCLHASEEENVIPAETVRVARSSLPKGNVYLRMRDELGVWYHDRDFAALFSRRATRRKRRGG